MTGNEMLARVRSIIHDSGATYIADDDVFDWLNEGQRDLAHRLGVYEAEATGTTSGSTLAIPSGLIEVKGLRVSTDDVRWVDSDEWWDWSDSAATPDVTLARIFNDLIEMYPTPTTGTAYRLRYTKEPADIAAGGTSTLPVGLHEKMLRFAQAKAKYKDGDVGEADRLMGEYVDGLPPHPLGRTRNNPGPLVLSFEAGPFDVSEAKHL